MSLKVIWLDISILRHIPTFVPFSFFLMLSCIYLNFLVYTHFIYGVANLCICQISDF